MTFANPDFAEEHSLSVSSLSAPLIRQIQHDISIAYSAGEMRRLAALVAVCLCLAWVPGQPQESVPSALNWLLGRRTFSPKPRLNIASSFSIWRRFGATGAT